MHAVDTQGQSLYRLVAIDPGTNALGVAVLDIDVDLGQLVVRHAGTLDVQKLSQRYPQVIAIHGERVSKLHAVERALIRHFISWRPDCIASEAPYMGRFPQAYAALVECVTSIRRAVMAYDRSLPLNTYDPASVKMAVGVSGKSGDKSAMLKAISQHQNIAFDVDIATLDEHAIDAIAVGYAHYRSHV